MPETTNTWEQDYNSLKGKWIEKAKAKNPEIEKEIEEVASIAMDDPKRKEKEESFITKYGDIFIPEEEQRSYLGDRYDSYKKAKEEYFQKNNISTKTTSDPEGTKYGTRHLFYQNYITPSQKAEEKVPGDLTLDYRISPFTNKNHNVIVEPGSRKTLYDFESPENINQYIADIKAGKQRNEIPGAYWDAKSGKIKVKSSQPQESAATKTETKSVTQAPQNQSVFTKYGGVSNWYNKKT